MVGAFKITDKGKCYLIWRGVLWNTGLKSPLHLDSFNLVLNKKKALFLLAFLATVEKKCQNKKKITPALNAFKAENSHPLLPPTGHSCNMHVILVLQSQSHC